MDMPRIDDRPLPAARRNAGAGLWKLRLRAAAIALAAIAFGGFYFFVRQRLKDGLWAFDLYLFNKSLATASLFLVALSMMLTGIGYFSRRPGRALALRKHYGLAGFWVGLAHGLVSHLCLPDKFPLASWAFEHPAASASGLAALLLFGTMAAFSNAGAKGRVGGELWRRAFAMRGTRPWSSPASTPGSSRGPAGRHTSGASGPFCPRSVFRSSSSPPGRSSSGSSSGGPRPGNRALTSAFPVL
jgi:hypothetical protein